MDRGLVNRLEQLERGALDILDPRTATTQQLEDHLSELLGRWPTNADLERLIAKGEGAAEPEE